jgi:hypothetical protein
MLKVNLDRFPGPATVRWFNPAGALTTRSGGTLPNRRTHVLRTPGDNGTGTNDWVMILDAR